MDDNYTDFDEELDPGGYDAAGYEGDGSPQLPDGHWAHDQSWLQWMDQFASQLQGDEALLEKFNEFLGTLGEPEAAAAPAGGDAAVSWPSSSGPHRPLGNPEMLAAARDFLRQGRESGR